MVASPASATPASASPPPAADATIVLERPSGRPTEVRLRIVHVSDTHDKAYALPDGDVLVHSGDMTDGASPEELARFREFLQSLPHRRKILVCGSHEAGLDRMKPTEVESKLSGGHEGCVVLHDASVTIEGVKFYGTPWNNSAKAFAMSPEACEIKFQRIPADTDVLVTHQPPHGVLDIAYPTGQFELPDENAPPCADCGGAAHPGGKHWGSAPLRRKVDSLGVPVHLFGRSHHSAGVERVGRTVFSNGSMEVKGRPTIIDIIVRPAPTPVMPGQSPVAFGGVPPPLQVTQPLSTAGMVFQAQAPAASRVPVVYVSHAASMLPPAMNAQQQHHQQQQQQHVPPSPASGGVSLTSLTTYPTVAGGSPASAGMPQQPVQTFVQIPGGNVVPVASHAPSSAASDRRPSDASNPSRSPVSGQGAADQPNFPPQHRVPQHQPHQPQQQQQQPQLQHTQHAQPATAPQQPWNAAVQHAPWQATHQPPPQPHNQHQQRPPQPPATPQGHLSAASSVTYTPTQTPQSAGAATHAAMMPPPMAHYPMPVHQHPGYAAPQYAQAPPPMFVAQGGMQQGPAGQMHHPHMAAGYAPGYATAPQPQHHHHHHYQPAPHQQHPAAGYYAPPMAQQARAAWPA